MGDLSKSVIFDAGKHKPRQWTTKVGVRRVTERAPNGAVERWVDGQGNVVFAQLLQPASLRRRPEDLDAARSKLTRKGWVQHGRCPLTAGTLRIGDFPDELRSYCADGTYSDKSPCVHVQHVVATRQGDQAAKMKQLEDQFFAEKHAREALEREKIAATDRLNDRLAQVLERAIDAQPAAPAKKAKE